MHRIGINQSRKLLKEYYAAVNINIDSPYILLWNNLYNKLR